MAPVPPVPPVQGAPAGSAAAARPPWHLALLALVAFVVGWAWAPALGLHLTGEDFTILGRVVRGEAAYPHVFRPLAGAWLAALHALFGAGSGEPYHAATLALHLANAGLVFLLARRLLGSPWTAAACAVAFGLGAGVRDSLFWVAAVNRPLSTFFLLVAANGLVRLGERRWRPALVAGSALVLQLGVNEDAYGTALLAVAWCAWRACREPALRRRAAALGLVAAAAVSLHYVAVDVPGGADALLGGGVAGVAAQVRRSALERLGTLASGFGLPAAAGLWLPLVGALLAALAGRARAAGFGLLMLGASFVPFALSDAVGYRAYPSQAPAVLLAVGGPLALVERLFRGGWSGAWAPPVAFGLALALVGDRAAPVRRRGLERWRLALEEIAACDAPLRALAADEPGRAPVSVNIETTTMGLVFYLWPSIPEPGDVVYRGFLDASNAYVAPPDHPPGTWFGRRCEGSFGVIEPERYFAQRAEIEPIRLYAEALDVPSLRAALAALVDQELDATRTAVVEAPAGAAAALAGPGSGEAQGMRLEVLEPLEVLVPNESGRLRVRVVCARPAVLAYQESWLYDPAFRFPPDQAIFSGVREVRPFALEAATASGERLVTFAVNAYGLGALVPAGEHEVELRFRRRTPAELRTGRDG